MSEDNGSNGLRKRREEIVREHIDAENRHDVEGILATFHYPRYDVAPLGEPNDGADAVRDLITGLIIGFPDFNFQPHVIHHADKAVIVEGRMTGTQLGHWAGIPPMGGRMDVRVLCIFEFDADQLMCEKVYFDFGTVMRQLGAI